MKKEIITTKDGSHTISIPELNVTYHSVHGAIQESKHVFIKEGLHYLINHSTDQPFNIFEMGFGTGLNAFLTAIEGEKIQKKINYVAVEEHPITSEELKLLNYSKQLQHEEIFERLHECQWNKEGLITELFTLKKISGSLLNFSTSQPFDLIYYDAFAPSAQPELWTKEIFQKLFNLLKPGGVLVTYCSKGDVRRAMMAAGFDVKKLPGPPGKREMLRAKKH